MELYGDFQTSVIRAFNEIDLNWGRYPGLVICGSHNPLDSYAEPLIEKIKYVREGGVPFLGLCYGHQLACIEYARNVLGIRDATSEEFGVPGTCVVKKRGSLKVGEHDGESYWSNYDISLPSGVVWDKADNFITVPYHPEYESSIDNPHPLLVKFLKLCKDKK